MITLTAQIKLLGADKGTLTGISTNLLGNNISSQFSTLLGARKQGSNPFIIGASKLGDGSTFSDKVDYYIGSQLSDSEGNFETPYTITVSGKNISSLTIAFDKVNGRHPNTINIDGTDYYDDDAIFTITDLPIANTHTITISNWNSPNYPLVLTGVYVEINIDLNYRNLISIESNIKARSDMKFPSFGIISNSGSIEFNDYDGEIADYAEKQLLQSDLKVYINLKDTLTKVSEQVGEFETREWDYDNDNFSVSVSLKDDLEEWQDIYCEGINYDPRYSTPQKLKYFYEHLYKQTPSKYNMLSFDELDSETQRILNNTTVKYPLLESGNLWSEWTKLCEVGGLYIFKLNNGRTACRYYYGG